MVFRIGLAKCVFSGRQASIIQEIRAKARKAVDRRDPAGTTQRLGALADEFMTRVDTTTIELNLREDYYRNYAEFRRWYRGEYDFREAVKGKIAFLEEMIYSAAMLDDFIELRLAQRILSKLG